MAYNPLKGKYQLKNPHKYKGDRNNVVYRSSWELKAFNMCDLGENILEWSSEEVVIPYRSPLDGRVHRYFPDLKIKIKTPKGIETWIIEIKPFKETQEPRPQKRKTKGYIRTVETWAKNSSKWKSARTFCEDRKYSFKIFTERELKI
jgi:hypothetical protein